MLEAIRAVKDRCPVFRYVWIDTKPPYSLEYSIWMKQQRRLILNPFELSKFVENDSDLFRQPLFLRLDRDAVTVQFRINPFDTHPFDTNCK